MLATHLANFVTKIVRRPLLYKGVSSLFCKKMIEERIDDRGDRRAIEEIA